MNSASVAAPKDNLGLGDSFARGVLLMLVINIGQRAIGLIRNLGFCQFLSDADLGLWSLANSFFMIAAPFAVLGLPGSFGKFAEYYRQRGCLRTYLVRVTSVSLGATLLLAGLMILCREQLGWLIYGESTALSLVIWTAIVLVSQVGYNIAFDVTISLRQVSVTSRMQFATGTSFTVLGIAWLSLGGAWTILLPCYAIACLLGMVVGLWSVWSNCRGDLGQNKPITHRQLWPRILPFAASLWAANLLTNAFELSDRYLLLHLSPGGEDVGQALVGQYYCGRIIPNLLTSIALMLAGILLPYLSADWEAGRKDSIQRRMQQVLSLLSLLFTGIAILSLLVSPLLFKTVFEGRYSTAEAILGLSLLQCIWTSMHFVSASYLFCAERVNSHNLNLLSGLGLNVVLGWILIPAYGLTGAVIATLIANFAVMLLTFRSMRIGGCPVTGRTLVFAIFPAVILTGPTIAAMAAGVLFWVASRTDWLLTDADRHEMDLMVIPKLNRVGVPLDSLWP
jgi:polysaccharide transporter, PST family